MRPRSLRRLQIGHDDSSDAFDRGPHFGNLKPTSLNGAQQLQMIGLAATAAAATAAIAIAVGRLLLTRKRWPNEVAVLTSVCNSS